MPLVVPDKREGNSPGTQPKITSSFLMLVTLDAGSAGLYSGYCRNTTDPGPVLLY